MIAKLFDSELRIMNHLWNEGDMTAAQLVKILKQEVGWNKNTTYTVIKKCIEKGAIERTEPNFMCRAIIPKEDVCEYETTELISKLFNGSADLFLASYVNGKNLTSAQIIRLKELIEELK